MNFAYVSKVFLPERPAHNFAWVIKNLIIRAILYDFTW
jgi:hypothetical protein